MGSFSKIGQCIGELQQVEDGHFTLILGQKIGEFDKIFVTDANKLQVRNTLPPDFCWNSIMADLTAQWLTLKNAIKPINSHLVIKWVRKMIPESLKAFWFWNFIFLNPDKENFKIFKNVWGHITPFWAIYPKMVKVS